MKAPACKHVKDALPVVKRVAQVTIAVVEVLIKEFSHATVITVEGTKKSA